MRMVSHQKNQIHFMNSTKSLANQIWRRSEEYSLGFLLQLMLGSSLILWCLEAGEPINRFNRRHVRYMGMSTVLSCNMCSTLGLGCFFLPVFTGIS